MKKIPLIVTTLALAAVAHAQPALAVTHTPGERQAAAVGAAHFKAVLHNRFGATIATKPAECFGYSGWYTCGMPLYVGGELLGFWNWHAHGSNGHYWYDHIKYASA